MSSIEDMHSQLITTNNTSTIICMEQSSSSSSSGAILLVNSPISPVINNNEAADEYPPNTKTSYGKQVLVKSLTITAISQLLKERKSLHNQLRIISDIMCFLGIIGIILMIIENEIIFHNINHHDKNSSWSIRFIITISTIILICLIIYYHYLDLRLYATYHSIDFWLLGLTIKRTLFIIFEILICAIHPILRTFPHSSITDEQNQMNSTLSNNSTSSYDTSLDVILGLPMFLRLYLICRCITFHSYLVRHAPSKSFGSLSQVSINLTFLIKTYLEQWPARVLFSLCVLIFLIGSWSIRACEYKPTDTENLSMFDSTWLFVVTFTTVGYGDITPSTKCGRTVVSIIALFGLLASALVISVVAQKLKLTRWEKYVHYFVSDIDLTRKRREQSANIIKFSIKVWYLKRKSNRRLIEYLKTQRLLVRSIHTIRKIKSEQRKLNDNCLDLMELISTQRSINSQTKNMEQEIITMRSTMNNIQDKFNQLNNTLNLFMNRTNP